MKKSNKILLSVFAIVVILTIAVLTNVSAFENSEEGKCGVSFLGFGNTEKGNGKLITQNFPVNNFTRINISGKADVSIQPGKTNNVSITTDENILPYLKVQEENSQLSIGRKSHASLAPSKEAIIITTNTDVNEINLGGKVNLIADNLQSNDLDLAMGGKSHAQLTGNIKNLQITAGGKSDIEAKVLHGEILRLNIGGKGNTHLSGDVNTLIISTASKANIDAQKLIAKDVTINGAGKSDIYVQANKILSTNITGESHIYYKGNPTISKNNIGSVSIEKMD